MKFGEIVMAVASMAVIDILLLAAMLAIFVPMNSTYGPDIAGSIALLVASLIVGYVFAAKIQEESKVKTIGRIVVVFAVIAALTTMALFTNPYTGAAVEEGLESMYSTGSWTATDWLAYTHLVLILIVALNVVFALIFGFIGLYIGSMLRRPRKS